MSRGDIKRLILNVPPRHMKSLTCNVFWPSWDWIANPGRHFLFASYRSGLSERDNERARRLVMSDWYLRHAHPNGDALMPGSVARVDDWTNRYHGRRLVASIGRGATGDGGDIVVIDDPISADDARSAKALENVIFWWEESIRSRLNDPANGAFVIIMQRLHEADLTGHILATETGWDHLCLPARYEPDHPFGIRSSIGFVDPRSEPGELLWADRMGEEGYNQIAPEGTYADAGQNQQRPAPREGGLFQRSDFTILDTCPPIKRWVRGWDLAGSIDGDWTAGVRMGERADGEGVVIAHVRRLRQRPGKVEAAVYAATENDQLFAPTKAVLPKDPGQAGVAQKRTYSNLLRRFPIGFETPSMDKEARAAPFAAQAELGRVYLLRGAWNEPFINELCLFPRGKWDDQVDAAATAYNELAGGAVHGFA